MLILSREIGEQIEVDGPCVITFAELRGNQIRLGFEADRSVNIWRRELLEESRESRKSVERTENEG